MTELEFLGELSLGWKTNFSYLIMYLHTDVNDERITKPVWNISYTFPFDDASDTEIKAVLTSLDIKCVKNDIVGCKSGFPTKRNKSLWWGV